MKLSELKDRYGAEYPAAIVWDGIRMPMQREGRFSRSYSSDERKVVSRISRFMDGSASISATELQHEWPTWNDETRMDFCGACGWLHKQPDFQDMLRFVMKHGSSRHWSSIALDVASCLPQLEAFDILVRALHSVDADHTSNISQAIAMTKNSGAETVLRHHLAALWTHPDLWKGADFLNWIGFDATTCISNLIDLGAPLSDFAEQVRRLSEHVCQRNRESCHNFLSKHYAWLKKSDDGG
ncbi:MAG: hypothetical protein WCS99_09625 [Limisphaerales bacterium]